MTANGCAKGERQLRPMLVVGVIAVNVFVLVLVGRAYRGDRQPTEPAASTAPGSAVAGTRAGGLMGSTRPTPSPRSGVVHEPLVLPGAAASATKGVAIATVIGPNGSQDGIAASPAGQPEGARKVRYMTASDYRLSGSAPTLAELEARAEQVTYEANRRLAMLTATYKLTPAQQALVYPLLARASQAYDPALSIDGEAATDAYLRSIDSTQPASAAGASESSAYAGVPVESSSEPDSPASRAAAVAEYASRRTGASAAVATSGMAGDSGAVVATADSAGATDGGTAAAVAPSSSTAPDGYDAALASSLDTVEAELTPFLDNDQLATMSDEQVDRYYWWAEILGNLSGTTTDPAASETAATTTQPEDGTSSTTEGDPEEPSSYQGGNLLDLLNP